MYNLMFSSLGNGITVCDRDREEFGDYKKIAHINPERQVTYYEEVPGYFKSRIENFARTDDSYISATQPVRVFKTRPELTKAEIIEKLLPQGSGIDCQWEIEDKGSYVKACNSYHCMNDVGFYDGYADFSVVIPKKDFLSFKLHFHGATAQYKNKRYMLREYLDDIIYWSLKPDTTTQA